MKLNTLHRPKFFAEYWDFTTTLDEINGRVDTYFKVGDLELILTTGGEGVVSVWSPSELRHNASLRNLRDAKGTLVFTDTLGNAVDAFIGNGEPYFDFSSRIAGYRYNLHRGTNQ